MALHAHISTSIYVKNCKYCTLHTIRRNYGTDKKTWKEYLNGSSMGNWVFIQKKIDSRFPETGSKISKFRT